MSSDDEKRNPANDEYDSDFDADEKSKLLSSRESSPTPSDDDNSSPDPKVDARFVQPAPSPLKRLALVLFLGFLFWLAYQMRGSLLEGKRNPKIVHASRYSKEYKFRPAASPIITETLKDGRVRLRGALPAPTEPPAPIIKKKAGTGKVTGKRKTKKPKRKSSAAEKRM